MKRLLFAVVLLMALGISSCGPADDHTYAEIETEFGTIKLMLYNSTPKHRDNFIKLANDGFYEDLLFHRVMDGFMIQGGDPDSKTAAPGQQLGQGGPGYQIDPEIGAPHITGALAAARQPDHVNPQKRSSGSQFYIVHGSPVDDNFLNQMEAQKGIKYNETQRKLYKELGGYPPLDNDYTVYGEVVEGFEVIDQIAKVPKDGANRPNQDVKMKVRILK